MSGGSKAHGEGRVRRALEKALEAAGWKIAKGHGLTGTVGHYRIYRELDDQTVRWETWATHAEHRPFPLHLVSYDTMTACARGFTTMVDEGTVWVYAEKRPDFCLLCKKPIKRGPVSFLDNDDPKKGAAHLACANKLKPGDLARLGIPSKGRTP